MLEIRFAKEEELPSILELRKKVFHEEQNIPAWIEQDGKENEAEHIAVFLDKKLIGCARLRIVEKRAKLERIVVLPEYRRKGIGKKIIDFLIKRAKEHNVREAFLIGQSRLKKFYCEKGFRTKGKQFLIAGLPHYEFVSSLR